jgi:hypothetical protein
MSDEWFTDIEDPAEAGGLRSKDLYNRVVLVRPVEQGEDEGEDGPYTFWTCDVAILNQAGVEEHSRGVRIGWKLIQKGLANRQGRWILAKAVQKGNAWVLDPHVVPSAARQIAAGLRDEVEALFAGSAPAAAPAPTAPAYDDGEEPFR